ncbi:Oxoglutarate/iron-dependent dioxygenase, partial [Parasponia andersonii]
YESVNELAGQLCNRLGGGSNEGGIGNKNKPSTGVWKSVNVVKGLKLYEDVFTDSEVSKLIDFVIEYRAAGQNGELSGETYILFNQQMKGNKRELIQFGVPIFGQIKEEAATDNQTSNEPIPTLLQNVIDHLIQWKLIPEYKRPNGCIISFFEEGEYSQPFLKPPHLDQPISTLLLSESTMAFGRILVSDNDGNYKGPLMLSLKEGSLLVMRGNSSDMARHVMCPSPNTRVSVTFFRVRPESNQCQSPTSPTSAGAMTLWQPAAVPSPYTIPNGGTGYESMDLMPKWGVLRGPVVMLAPVRPMVLSPRRAPRGGNGTGVFLPWAVNSRKPAKHLPPRAQRGRFLSLPPHTTVEARVEESTSEAGNNIDAK